MASRPPLLHEELLLLQRPEGAETMSGLLPDPVSVTAAKLHPRISRQTKQSSDVNVTSRTAGLHLKTSVQSVFGNRIKGSYRQ